MYTTVDGVIFQLRTIPSKLMPQQAWKWIHIQSWQRAKSTYFEFNSFKTIQKYQVYSYSWVYYILFWQGFHLVSYYSYIKTIKIYSKILIINLFPKNLKMLESNLFIATEKVSENEQFLFLLNLKEYISIRSIYF